jgi:hypothetical protein
VDKRRDSQPENEPDHKPFLPRGLWYIVAGGVCLFGILYYLSRAFSLVTDRYAFIAQGGVNILIFLGILVQALIYRRQWDAMERSLFQAERSSIYANRAYLVAKIRNKEPYQFKLWIQNGGNTPATNVIVCYACRVMQDPPWQLDKQTGQVAYSAGSDIEVRLGVIAPNGSHETVWTVAFTPKTDVQKQEWENGVKLFCWGRIYYEDMFNKGRHTDFCFYKSLQKPEGYPSEYGNEVF